MKERKKRHERAKKSTEMLCKVYRKKRAHFKSELNENGL